MSFESTERVFAIPANILGRSEEFRLAYGGVLKTGLNEVVTLLGYKDRTDSDELRAGMLGVDVRPILLTNGKLAIHGYWSVGLATKWQYDKANDGELKDVDEITLEQLRELNAAEQE
jgi:hypothetical protein